MHEKLIDVNQLQSITGVAASTWDKKRMRGDGPPFYKFGQAKTSPVRYKLREVMDWIDKHRCSATEGGRAVA